MESLNLADTFVTFLALLGPQKVLLSFAHLGRELDVKSVRLVAWTCSLAAACVGVVCALTAPLLASFFHISVAAVNLIFAWALAPLLPRAHEIVLDVLSRLLGVLLAAVGVQLFRQGLVALGVLPGSGGH